MHVRWIYLKLSLQKKSKSEGIWRCHSHFTSKTILKNEVKISEPNTEKCRRDSVISIVSRLRAELPVFDSQQGRQSFLSPTTSRPAPRCSQPPTEWVSWVLSPETSGRRVKWTTQQMGRMCEAVTLLPTYACTVCRVTTNLPCFQYHYYCICGVIHNPKHILFL